MKKQPFHCLVAQSGSRYIAHCLEYDLVTSADTYHEAVRRLNLIVATKEGADHPAPEAYWKKFEVLVESNNTFRQDGTDLLIAPSAHAIS